ncbi:hypothetical protein B0H10DRAFT_1988444 [Mycena sp. CBHHK59/15]|nr:hypothetical protein B0H10DRAFT_1988444 [Mycena sp. CBHHK59/15]
MHPPATMSLLRVLPRVCTRVSCRPPRPQLARRPFFSSSSRRSYHPGYFRFLDNVPEDTVFWGIIGLNGLVFGMSWWAMKKLQVQRNTSMFIWMRKNFTSSWANISSGRIWTLFTSTFKHNDRDITHILFNGFTFYFLAPAVLRLLGSRHFLFLYLGGGAVAELGSIAWTNIVHSRDPASCGASAAIYSILSYLACAAPGSKIYLYAILPVPTWLLVSGLFAYDTYRTATDKVLYRSPCLSLAHSNRH